MDSFNWTYSCGLKRLLSVQGGRVETGARERDVGWFVRAVEVCLTDDRAGNQPMVR